MGRYLGSLLESIRGELDSAGIDADARVLFVGSGALPTSALVLAREVGAHLCCLDIDEEALGCAREIARCQGLEARMQFSSLPPAELEGWRVCAERVSQPLYDTLILEKAGR